MRVCQNCHHLLRSCPCVNVENVQVVEDGEGVGRADGAANHSEAQEHPVYCRHMPFDYADIVGESVHSADASLKPYCDCYHCSTQRFRVMEPVVSSRIAKYRAKGSAVPRNKAEMFTPQEAILRGYAVHQPPGLSSSLKEISNGDIERNRAQLLNFIQTLYAWIQQTIDRSIAKTKGPAATVAAVDGVDGADEDRQKPNG